MDRTFGQNDRLSIDILSGSMYSLNFLRNISVAIFDKAVDDMTVRDFHSVWLKDTNYTDHFVPYCLGSIMGYLYCGILLAKERWFDFLPEDSLKDATDKWGLAEAKCTSPKKPDPSVKYVVRRMRNALGHGNITINVPHDLDYKKDEFDFEKRSSIVFKDENVRDRSDVFSIEVTIYSLVTLVTTFYEVVYPEIGKGTEPA